MSKTLAVENIFAVPRYAEHHKTALDAQEKILSSLNELADAHTSKAIDVRIKRVYKNLLSSEDNQKKQEFFLHNSVRLLINSHSIFKKLERCAKGQEELSREVQQALYLAWDREPQEDHFAELERKNGSLASDIMGLRQEISLDRDSLREEIEQCKSSRSLLDRLIALPRVEVLLGELISASGLWVLTIHAFFPGVGPLLMFGVPVAVTFLVMGLKTLGAALSDTLHAKIDPLIELDTKVITPLLETFAKMLSDIGNDTKEIKGDMKAGVKALNETRENVQDLKKDVKASGQLLSQTLENAQDIRNNTQQIFDSVKDTKKDVKDIKVVGGQLVQDTAQISRDTKAIKQVGSQLVDSINRTDGATRKIVGDTQAIKKTTQNIKDVVNQTDKVTQQIATETKDIKEGVHQVKEVGSQLLDAFERNERNMQAGVAAINGNTQSLKRIEEKIDNQQPAVVNNNFILDASGVAALASLPPNHPLLLMFVHQAAALQITGASSSANLEESSSTATSRSSSPAPELPSSSKGKGKAPATATTVEVDEEEYQLLLELRMRRQMKEVDAKLEAA